MAVNLPGLVWEDPRDTAIVLPDEVVGVTTDCNHVVIELDDLRKYLRDELGLNIVAEGQVVIDGKVWRCETDNGAPGYGSIDELESV